MNSGSAFGRLLWIFLVIPVLGTDSGSFQANSEGLFYSVLESSTKEWNATFRDDGKEQGPIHLWLKCRNSELRAYFFIESRDSLRARAAELPISAGSFDVRASAFGQALGHTPFAFVVENHHVSALHFDFAYGGGEWTEQVPCTDRSMVSVGIRGWASFVWYPCRLCSTSKERIPKSGTRAKPAISVVLYDAERDANVHSVDWTQNTLLVAQHLLYHICTLNIKTYELISPESMIPTLLSNSFLAASVRKGILRIITIPSNPPAIDGNPLIWQAVNNNLAILRHWQTDESLFFVIDTDEYLYLHPGRESSAKLELSTSDAFLIDRQTVLCAACGDVPELSTFDKNAWVAAEHFLGYGKVAVSSSSSVHAMMVHSVTAENVVQLRNAHILHFVNLAKFRISSDGMNTSLLELRGGCWHGLHAKVKS